MHWHLWRRRYNLYADKAQFASVDSGFLAVDFDMRDIHGKKIASVNKDFTGFAREIFTDARQYVLRLDPSFGLQSDGMLVSDAATVDLASEPLSDVELGHRERAIIMATAISIDFGKSCPSVLPHNLPHTRGSSENVFLTFLFFSHDSIGLYRLLQRAQSGPHEPRYDDDARHGRRLSAACWWRRHGRSGRSGRCGGRGRRRCAV